MLPLSEEVLILYQPQILELRGFQAAKEEENLTLAHRNRLREDEQTVRRSLVWRLSTEQWLTQAQIAEVLNISQPTVSRDLTNVEEQIRAHLMEMIETEKLLQIAQLKHMATQLVAAWEASKENSLAVTRRQGIANEEAVGAVLLTTHTTGREGDRGYLAEARRCLADIRAILGADAPIRISASGDPLVQQGVVILLPDNNRNQNILTG
jgi:predicted transcriptional regulator